MGAENSTPEVDKEEGAADGAPGAAPAASAASYEELSEKEAVDMIIKHTASGEKTAGTMTTVEACCKRIRVLCRDQANCDACDKVNASVAIVSAMDLYQEEPKVQLQALAALVNLCSGEGSEHRQHAVEADCLRRIVNAMKVHLKNSELQDMACIALQNCCYGEDENAVERRQKAAAAGAIETTVQAMRAYPDLPVAQEVGIATLKLMVHKCADNKAMALAQGVPEEQLEPPSSKGKGGFLSFRTGFGTQRRKAKAAS